MSCVNNYQRNRKDNTEACVLNAFSFVGRKTPSCEGNATRHTPLSTLLFFRARFLSRSKPLSRPLLSREEVCKKRLPCRCNALGTPVPLRNEKQVRLSLKMEVTHGSKGHYAPDHAIPQLLSRYPLQLQSLDPSWRTTSALPLLSEKRDEEIICLNLLRIHTLAMSYTLPTGSISAVQIFYPQTSLPIHRVCIRLCILNVKWN